MCLFFIKQKTAYEMRISDWSSDVCSSDLRERGEPDMNPFEMVLGIIIVVTIGKILQARFAAGGTARGSNDSQEALRLREEVRALKERIQTLERLATDDNSSARLDREIEALRERSNERTDRKSTRLNSSH